MRDLRELQPKRVVLTLPAMEEAQVTKDRVYKTVDDVDLTMDVYRPARIPSSDPLPAVILVAGTGPWEVLQDIKN